MMHPDIFPPTFAETIVTLLICILNSFGSAAGVAEAGLLTPYLIMFLEYSIQDSVNAAYAVGLGGALGNFLNVAFIKNAKTSQPMVNYEINLVVIPMLMVGVTIGSTIRLVVPDLSTEIVMFCILAFSFYKFFKNLKKQTRIERDYGITSALVSQDNSSAEEQVSQPLIDDSRALENLEPASVVELRQRRLFPMDKILESMLNVITIVLFALLRGSKSTESIIGIPYCGGAYWLLDVIMALVFIGLFIRSSHLVQKWQKERSTIGLPLSSNELVFTKKKVLIIGLLATVAGTLGAIVAIGGALILIPFFLSWGLPPKEASLTCSFFVMFTLFNTTFDQIMSGSLSIQQVVWFGGIAFVCSFSSSRLVTAFVAKTGKQSLLLKLLLVVCTFSIVTGVYVVVSHVSTKFDAFIAFKSIC